MVFKPVTSSNLESVAYDAEEKALYVVFKSTKKVYKYADVPEGVYQSLLTAESVGKYFNSNIKNVYSFTTV